MSYPERMEQSSDEEPQRAELDPNEPITISRAELEQLQQEAKLAGAKLMAATAQHLLNNQLGVSGYLDLIREDTSTPGALTMLDTLDEGLRDVAQTVAKMGQVKRLVIKQTSPGTPPFLDLDQSIKPIEERLS